MGMNDRSKSRRELVRVLRTVDRKNTLKKAANITLSKEEAEERLRVLEDNTKNAELTVIQKLEQK